MWIKHEMIKENKKTLYPKNENNKFLKLVSNAVLHYNNIPQIIT